MIRLRFSLTQGAFHVSVDQALNARITALFGPSGSGKTTVLEAIAGLRRIDEGTIAVGEHVLADSMRRIDLPARLRRVGYVPQDVALFPHLSVRRNVLYGARAGSLSPGRVLEILEIAHLDERSSVVSLSGGERQRVAIARALMSAPSILLLDEPLAAVDEDRRRRIVECLVRVRDEIGVPVIYVTHDAGEVRAIADHAVLLERGAVTAAGPPGRVLPERASEAAR
jgi:molybdate transport system ATP-binding protein